MSREDKPIRVPVDLIEEYPGLIDKVLDTLDGKPLSKPTPCKTPWGKYQTLAIRKDGHIMKPFRG